jgi:glucosamine kinase
MALAFMLACWFGGLAHGPAWPVREVVMSMGFDYLVGIDGGGSGTRVRLADAAGRELAQGHAGPSALMGAASKPAWRAIKTRPSAALLAQAGLTRAPPQRLALGLGVAGANHAPWLLALRQTSPP